MAALASRVASELHQLAGLALDLQDALSAAGVAQKALGEAMAGLQAIDRITQNLGDLSRLLTALGGQLTPSTTIATPPLADGLILRDLAHRLFGTEGIVAEPRETSETGASLVGEPARSGEISWF
ncbi:hypothetical protein OU426_00710 [Frigidibacter sp. RF13]|uniref:hypothetical protein n=1 Tax=Frigidibacter sp. RF13 TaxID=2997340 RepID=UPI00227077F7|nr:hypothetical protein [Frigidibacter sp. RF13]MCY1125362.1 hypothetical protein [Frigidibacter sp. RF13]